MKKKKSAKRLTIAKETLTSLDLQNVEPAGGAANYCAESAIICSVMHTCVSCQATEA